MKAHKTISPTCVSTTQKRASSFVAIVLACLLNTQMFVPLAFAEASGNKNEDHYVLQASLLDEGSRDMSLTVNVTNTSQQCISGVKLALNLPNRSDGKSEVDFVLTGPVPFNEGKGSVWYSLNRFDETSDQAPDSSGLLCADAVEDWSAVKAVLFDLVDLPVNSALGRVYIPGYDAAPVQGAGKTSYVSYVLYSTEFPADRVLSGKGASITVEKTPDPDLGRSTDSDSGSGVELDSDLGNPRDLDNSSDSRDLDESDSSDNSDKNPGESDNPGDLGDPGNSGDLVDLNKKDDSTDPRTPENSTPESSQDDAKEKTINKTVTHAVTDKESKSAHQHLQEKLSNTKASPKSGDGIQLFVAVGSLVIAGIIGVIALSVLFVLRRKERRKSRKTRL